MCDSTRAEPQLRDQAEDSRVGGSHTRSLMGPMVMVWPVSGSRIVMGVAPPARQRDRTGLVVFDSNWSYALVKARRTAKRGWAV